MLDSADKDFKAAVINMFKEVKETMLKELKENIVIMTQQTEIFNKEIKKKFLRPNRNSRGKK